MRCSKFFAVFLLFFIFGVQNVSARNVPIWKLPGLKGTKVENGCHKFFGKIECGNRRQTLPITPNAAVTVWEYDIIDSNDRISTSKIDGNGNYEIVGCAHDNTGTHVELFLEFNNVCFDGQSFLIEFPKPNVFESWTYLVENDDKTFTTFDAKYDLDSNPSLHLRRSKYPPMPRPHQYELADNDLDMMNNNNDDDFESDEYIFPPNALMPKYHRRSKYPPMPRPYDRRSYYQQQNGRLMNVEDEGVRSLH